jgi:hypothetical protein
MQIFLEIFSLHFTRFFTFLPRARVALFSLQPPHIHLSILPPNPRARYDHACGVATDLLMFAGGLTAVNTTSQFADLYNFRCACGSGRRFPRD